jgi:hypothetical protein
MREFSQRSTHRPSHNAELQRKKKFVAGLFGAGVILTLTVHSQVANVVGFINFDLEVLLVSQSVHDNSAKSCSRMPERQKKNE